MGRIAMVTRTINFTEVTALTVDVIAQSTGTQVFTLSGTFADNDKLIKALKKEYELETVKIVSVISSEVQEKLYGMTEQEFMSLAKVLPPRKVYGDTQEQPVEQEQEQPVEQEHEKPVESQHNKKGKRKGK